MQARWEGQWTQEAMLLQIPEGDIHVVPNIGMSISCRSLRRVASKDAWLNCDTFAAMIALYQVNLHE